MPALDERPEHLASVALDLDRRAFRPALLRGVNLGRRKVPIADLRGLLRYLGLDEVAPYLQSGKAVFASDRADRVALREIERHSPIKSVDCSAKNPKGAS